VSQQRHFFEVENTWIGLDIGGANIKLAHVEREDGDSSCERLESAISFRFELWKYPDRLAETLRELLDQFEPHYNLAVTMTGELADCFANRQTGVAAIVDAVLDACIVRNTNLPRLLRFYQLDLDGSGYRWADAEKAKENWLSTAAANWHATACFLGRINEKSSTNSGFLIDIGSTTTDIIPIRRGIPLTQGKTDLTRLQNSELIYAGVQRTPICSLIESFDLNGKSTAVAREFFATMEDALLVAGSVSEEPDRCDTADGRSVSLKCARQRMSKMICADAAATSDFSLPIHLVSQSEWLNDADIVHLAQQCMRRLESLVAGALNKVVARNSDLPLRFWLAGKGAGFIESSVASSFERPAEIIRLASLFGDSISQNMAAYAVAKLAASYFQQDSRNGDINLFTSECLALRERRIEKKCSAQLVRVIKLGGSLLSRAETPIRIRNWLNQLKPMKNIWIVGGGSIVDAVRHFDSLFPLDESVAHWICLDSMSINARLVQSWFPDWPIVAQFNEENPGPCGDQNENILLDLAQWLRHCDNARRRSTGELGKLESLPESWSVSSDTCAAYVAERIGAQELILLKSCSSDPDHDFCELAQAGIVDSEFPAHVQAIASVQIVNLLQHSLR
jgi:(4-(4-[2-(gamma-L-glutamylamino)ethyl]phenoxymethyl)furan-2-yl)methanamine synthase